MHKINKTINEEYYYESSAVNYIIAVIGKVTYVVHIGLALSTPSLMSGSLSLIAHEMFSHRSPQQFL